MDLSIIIINWNSVDFLANVSRVSTLMRKASASRFLQLITHLSTGVMR
jgi:hypothetical protein